MTPALAAAAGALVGCGLFLVVMGLRRAERTDLRARMASRGPDQDRRLVQFAAGATVALVVVLLTGRPVGAVLAGGIALSLPSVFGGKAARQAEIARVEAIATWAGQLRDMLTGGSGLLETIEATAPFAPAPIRAEVERLALGMRRGRLHAALRAFAADVDDPMADLVVASLIVATTEQVGRLGELLGSLATRTREQAALRMRIDKDRSSTRTQVRGVVIATIAMILGLMVFNKGLLAAYDSAEGQLVLAVIGAMFLAGFALLARMSRPQRVEGFTLAVAQDSA
ncbi:MAG TPA: type II secretion system F family protein [Acidimicrobiales bacterium]|nr:type II secretion system F family protein [Acidimicrobiales bacterium]